MLAKLITQRNYTLPANVHTSPQSYQFDVFNELDGLQLRSDIRCFPLTLDISVLLRAKYHPIVNVSFI